MWDVKTGWKIKEWFAEPVRMLAVAEDGIQELAHPFVRRHGKKRFFYRFPPIHDPPWKASTLGDFTKLQSSVQYWISRPFRSK